MAKTWKWQGITFKKNEERLQPRFGFPVETEWKAVTTGADWVVFKYKNTSYWYARLKTANFMFTGDGKGTRSQALWDALAKMKMKMFKYYSELAEYETALEDVKDE